MMTMIRVVALVALAASSVHAQEGTTLPEIRVDPPAAKATGRKSKDRNGADQKGTDQKSPDSKGADSKGNPDGRRGEDHALSRLNQQLKRKVDEVNPTGNNPPLDARSSDARIGIINIPGVQQQYGKNFGNSVVPFRPGPSVFTSPLGRPR